uniref:uncharacterized protein LOC120810118 isoform X1 n=1 Tax=Gasterosteus aculeatus aculeatus TaxID=481459 RepID=UPI0000E3A47F|nr:uncharacterized protein LOC120810118 isoform X1 [Gasterosteus aculeatus aculeatus]XP_040020334.1 uncharacterized protein LOC120810118 isoform X1 [Gasterosteus aculeatus aculeatus]
MSVTVTKGDGVTVFTMTSDSKSLLPPLCQILKNLCYSPVCCSVSQHLRSVQRNAQSVLGALHIMVGLLNVTLGVLLIYFAGLFWMPSFFPVWIGVIMMLFGIAGIVSEKRPSPCLVAVNVILNLAGVAFSITAIVLYSISIAHIGLWWMCNNYNGGYYGDYYGGRYRQATTTVSPEMTHMMEECLQGKELALVLLRGINGLLIVLSAMELCLAISSAVLGIKALMSRQKADEEKMGDAELYKPLVEEDCSQPAA